ncbi:MarR family winged helix-turn-helix transcriptional regulator, partial [Rhizobiaceae sp. 2RAB30]
HSSMHKTKVSRAVAELERRKWLQRTSDPNDRRVEQLVLTRAGDKIYRELVPFAEAFETAIFGKMSPAEKAAVATGLAALERAFARK